MKIQISFCGGVWSRICPQCEDSGQSRRSCCIAKWCISCKNNAPLTGGRIRGAFRVCGWAVCQRAESFRSTWRFLIYKEGRQDCTAPETGGGFPGKQPETPDVQHDFAHVTSCCGNVAERWWYFSAQSGKIISAECQWGIPMKRSEKITAQRKAHGLSQEELADRLSVSRQAVSRWEQGVSQS